MNTTPQLLQPSVKLTTGWPDRCPGPLNAAALHDKALAAPDYSRELAQLIQRQSNSIEILGLDQIFRKTTEGFQSIKQFVRALVSIPSQSKQQSTVVCQMDAFAYSFLKGAKNFDLLLPCDSCNNEEFLSIYRIWAQKIKQLEHLERSGRKIDDSLAKPYLKVRKIISRSSARDELRILVTLLISGPSTLKQLTHELGLSPILAGRILAAFNQINVLETQVEPAIEAETYTLTESALPIVIFCLREVMGVELLSSLVEEW